MKTFAAFASLFAALGLAAAPVAGDATLALTGEREYTITYSLADGPAVVTLGIETCSSSDGTGAWAPLSGEELWDVTGDVNRYVASSSGTIVWRPRPGKGLDGAALSRAVVKAWALDDLPTYLAVDLDAASACRIRYYENEAAVPGGVHDPLYRTSVLLLRRIPARGAIVMLGADDSEVGHRYQVGEDLREASFDHDYYMGVFEFTQGQVYRLIGTRAGSSFTLGGAMRPVESVAYNRVRESANNNPDPDHVWPEAPHPDSIMGKLRTVSKADQFAANGIDFDLPGDDQWEYACRAGCGMGYWNNGCRITGDLGPDEGFPGRYRFNQTIPSNETVVATCEPDNCTALCGSYEPNAWGLYDMHGNVWEFCAETMPDSEQRVRRGGGWNSTPRDSRSARRLGRGGADPAAFIGFRAFCRAGLK